MTKYCIDCRYEHNSYCEHPDLLADFHRREGRCLVKGVYRPLCCGDMRYGEDYYNPVTDKILLCGREGKYWEPK